MKKKDKLQKLIFLLLGVFLFLAVAEVGWIYANRSQHFMASVEYEVKEELVIAPFFVRLDSLMIPIIRNNRVYRHVMLTLALEVGDNHSRCRV